MKRALVLIAALAFPSFALGLSPKAKSDAKIPAKLREAVLAQSDLKGADVKINGSLDDNNHWTVNVNQGTGAGSKTQGFVGLASGKIIDKAPVQTQPADTDLK